MKKSAKYVVKFLSAIKEEYYVLVVKERQEKQLPFERFYHSEGGFIMSENITAEVQTSKSAQKLCYY